VRWIAWLVAVAAIVLLLAYLGWIIFKPAVEGADVFFEGGGRKMLQLYVVYLIVICYLGFLAVLLKWRWENDR
jgi:hypothetical protein